MSARYILAVDQGTTGTTVLVLGHDCAVRGRAYSEFSQSYPHPGWVEHDASEIWAVSHRVMAQALGDADIDASDLAAVGITNQRETTLLWDRASGEPVAPAIVWQDRRTASITEELRGAGHEDLVRRKTGLVLDP
ncbi:MAG: FGGY family carbohydrate kinase, partial [Chloroflexota bacterium]|nr:FGGY family carbohydrate kinase [Chloroflexota bacterium]